MFVQMEYYAARKVMIQIYIPMKKTIKQYSSVERTGSKGACLV